AAPALTDLVTHIAPVGLAGLAVPAVLHELIGALAIAHGDRDAVRALDAVLLGNRAVGVRVAPVLRGRHQLVFDATGMIEGENSLPEALASLYGKAALAQVPLPEPQRPFRHRQTHAADLPAALAGLAPRMAHGEARDQPTHIPRVVAVIEVQDRLVAVIESGLLDALQPEHLGMEVIVFLPVAHAQGEVVVALDVLVQAHLPVLRSR